ncbi:hypothetical protein BCV72DRAFT_212825 [Rhizopus microsporus var. microsporus]|uniref:Fungal-type protein kinase domain-containing protein n=1 Tax=Rhizopus microsporus var. microsporus TaxID=86635 RepID=A0A1X0QV79_RHIZD|nr:hypothetical protein BCV72DRAFT_212825 [Rhizopus microsporus var. microsporus]
MDKTIYDLCKHFMKDKTIISKNSEAIFTSKYTMPVFSKIFLDGCEKDAVYGMGKKSNLFLGLQTKGKNTYFFFIEVKRPYTTSKYKEEDFAKLLKQIRSSLDRQLFLGIGGHMSFGMLCFRCSLFRMGLHEIGIYMPVLIRGFLLVEETADVVHIHVIVESMMLVKEGLLS